MLEFDNCDTCGIQFKSDDLILSVGGTPKYQCEKCCPALAATINELPPHAYPPFVIIAVIDCFISHLPKPESPYEQAIAYRKLVGMG